jgi:GNAT superfamily N-acetyltransferase
MMNAVAPIARVTPGPGIDVGGGRHVTIRPINSGDSDDLCAFYRGLSPAARYARFLGTAAGMGDAAIRRFASADHAVAEGFVAVLHEQGPSDGSIVGHLCLEPDRRGGNELAVAVADGFRRQGIGSALTARAFESAHSRGIRRLTATMFATNVPMRRLMLDVGVPPAADDLDAGVESIELEMAG